MNVPNLVNPNTSNPGFPNYFQMMAEKAEVIFVDNATGQQGNRFELVSGMQAHEFTQRQPHLSNIVLKINMYAHLPHLGGGNHNFVVKLNNWHQLVVLLQYTSWRA